jgi:DNA-directed RNA polymerase subunit RPC12/RpoP
MNHFMGMSQNIMKSSSEKLDRVYVCTRCSAAFLFRSDVEYHEQSAGHGQVCEVPF